MTDEVVRVGDTVRRPAGIWTPAVHRLLDTLDRAGVGGVPRVVGLDSLGREVLTFIDGSVSDGTEPWLWQPSVLVDAARLLRRVHDASAGLATDAGPWRSPARRPAEVVCHNDVAPYNLVFREGAVAGLIDFDYASPGPRVWDLAYLAYRLVPYAEDAGPRAPTEGARARRLAQLIDAYGFDVTADGLRATMVARLDVLAAFSEEHATITGRSELREHAAMYRRDRDRLATSAG